uniref:Uncharacterized protein n=1 Tax=Parastrongyloides trichosuri TaxID=131310 RepID=A0A0N4ZVZ8_PARTI
MSSPFNYLLFLLLFISFNLLGAQMYDMRMYRRPYTMYRNGMYNTPYGMYGLVMSPVGSIASEIDLDSSPERK